MKKFFIVIFILILFLSVSCTKEDKYKVIKIVDGDTVYLDFNKNGVADKDEKVRINGIDTFETKINRGLYWQTKNYDMSMQEALGLGYYAKEFAKKELENKYVTAVYNADLKYDKNNRRLMSVYYDCENGVCKSYAKEVLKAGLSTVYSKSNIAEELKQYENLEKVKDYAKKSHELELVLLNKKSNKYHKVDCENAQRLSDGELVNKPNSGASPAGCCFNRTRR